MSPSQLYFDRDGSRNANNDLNIGCSYPPPLGVSKVSHCVKKLCPSSSASSTSSITSLGRNGGDRGRANGNSNNVSTNGKAQHRHPVIIYTHSPKIIQTHPGDFMALVQKLTGLSQSEKEDAEAPTLDPKMEDRDVDVNGNTIGKSCGGSEDTDASSVVTEENGICGGGDHGQVNSCFMPSVFDRPGNRPDMSVSFYMPNNSDLLCSNNQPGYYNFGDPGFLDFIQNNNIRNPFSYSNFQIRTNDLGDFSNRNIDF